MVFQGKSAVVRVSHISRDPKKFNGSRGNPRVLDRITALKRTFHGMKLMISVNRHDHLPQRVLALEIFCTKNTERIGKFVIIPVAVSSRQDVEQYISMVNAPVARINGKFGTSNTTFLDRLLTK